MAVPKTAEAVVAPAATVEAVVAQAAAEPVKAVSVEKEEKISPAAAPTTVEAITPSTDEASKAEDAPKIEESAEASSSDQDQETFDATPVEPSIPEWKEESNLVSDLKESEKKALEEFIIRIQHAIKNGEFKQIPEKVVKASKEQISSKAPESVVASTEEQKEELAPDAAVETASETPVVVVETSAIPVTDSPAVAEGKAKEVSSPAAPVVEVKSSEKSIPAEPKVEKSAAVVTEKVEAKAAPVVAAKVETAKAAPVVTAKVETSKAAPVVAAKVEKSKAAPVVAAKVDTSKGAPVVAAKVETSKVAPVVAAKVETTKAAPVVEEKVETKAASVAEKNVKASVAPVVAETVKEKTTDTTEETVEKKADSEEVPVITTNCVKSDEVKPDAVQAQAEEEQEDSTSQEDISLWGVPLLYTKGDERTVVILLKFLRAREFNVKEAFKQLRNAIIWRKTFNADNLLTEDFGTDLDGAAFMHGVTRDNQPVCYNVSGVFQDKELYQKTFGDAEKLQNFLRWRVQVLEKGIQLLSFTPEGPSAMVQITDLKNCLGAGKKDFKSAANQAINLLQDNYPELSSKRVFINAPKYFSTIYAVVSPLLTKRTKSKFVIAPAGNTTECLLKLISADNIPVQYGGLSRPNDTEFTPGSAPAEELVLKGRKSTQIEIDVAEVGSRVVWDLSVIGFDVTYGAEFVPSAEGSYTVIIEKSKKLSSTTEEPVRNSFKVTTPGKVILTVSNSSRKKKTILYRYIVKSTSAMADESS